MSRISNFNNPIQDKKVLDADASEVNFQAYQRSFTQHIRNPNLNPRPAGVHAKRMAIYTEIVFNNIEGTMSACFPVAKSVLSPHQWQRLIRNFLADYRASTPIFREIPQQMLLYLATLQQKSSRLPAFLAQLMHYEWVELALSAQMVTAEPQNEVTEQPSSPLDYIVLTPAMYLLQYDYPVHRIGDNFQPKKAEQTPTYLLVFRNRTDQIKFMELNPITFDLVTILQSQTLSAEHALKVLAQKHPHIAGENILKFGYLTLQTLKDSTVILGFAKAN